MERLTVGMIYESLGEIITRGGKDKIVLMTDDEEGNGFHAAFFTAQDDVEVIKQFMQSCMFDDQYDPEDVVLLG